MGWFFAFSAIERGSEFDPLGFDGLTGRSQAQIFCAKAQYYLYCGVISPG